jgi:pcfK
MENVIERKVVVNEFMVSLAEAKLMEEMSVPHSPDLDLIHNFICDELPYDIDLVTGILKEGRSIGGAYQYANGLAFKQYQSMEHKVKGVNGVAVQDTQVFEWVTEYFKLEFLEDSSGTPVAHMNAPTKNRKPRKKATPVVKVEDVKVEDTPKVPEAIEKTEDSSSQSATSLYEIGKSLGQSSPKAVEEVPKEKDLKLKKDGQFEFDLFGGEF